jgi:hypothetical protein
MFKAVHSYSIYINRAETETGQNHRLRQYSTTIEQNSANNRPVWKRRYMVCLSIKADGYFDASMLFRGRRTRERSSHQPFWFQIATDDFVQVKLE